MVTLKLLISRVVMILVITKDFQGSRLDFSQRFLHFKRPSMHLTILLLEEGYAMFWIL